MEMPSFETVPLESDRKPEFKAETRKFIQQRIREESSRLTLDNFDQVKSEILEDIENNDLAFDGAERLLTAYLGVRFAVLSHLRREELALQAGGKRHVTALDRLHAEWMGSTEEFIAEMRADQPEEIENFWQFFEQSFDESPSQEKKIALIYEYGVLAQMAAKGLIRDLGALAQETWRDIEVDIRSASAEEDVEDKVDFWIITKNGRREKELPCQVTYIDIGSGVRQDKMKKGEFVKNNYINFRCPSESQLRTDNTKLVRKIKVFFDRSGGTGAFIVLPRYENITLRRDGTTNEAVKSGFLARATHDKNFAKVFIP